MAWCEIKSVKILYLKMHLKQVWNIYFMCILNKSFEENNLVKINGDGGENLCWLQLVWLQWQAWVEG